MEIKVSVRAIMLCMLLCSGILGNKSKNSMYQGIKQNSDEMVKNSTADTLFRVITTMKQKLIMLQEIANDPTESSLNSLLAHELEDLHRGIDGITLFTRCPEKKTNLLKAHRELNIPKIMSSLDSIYQEYLSRALYTNYRLDENNRIIEDIPILPQLLHKPKVIFTLETKYNDIAEKLNKYSKEKAEEKEKKVEDLIGGCQSLLKTESLKLYDYLDEIYTQRKEKKALNTTESKEEIDVKKYYYSQTIKGYLTNKEVLLDIDNPAFFLIQKLHKYPCALSTWLSSAKNYIDNNHSSNGLFYIPIALFDTTFYFNTNSTVQLTLLKYLTKYIKNTQSKINELSLDTLSTIKKIQKLQSIYHKTYNREELADHKDQIDFILKQCTLDIVKLFTQENYSPERVINKINTLTDALINLIQTTTEKENIKYYFIEIIYKSFYNQYTFNLLRRIDIDKL
ncbi:hypothetical protein NEOKW01_1245 [Nematocida sp. AWRm80]|nr:hypothetical protein NEOKW01_1245 [Nematocida sp. AWRm80]